MQNCKTFGNDESFFLRAPLQRQYVFGSHGHILRRHHRGDGCNPTQLWDSKLKQTWCHNADFLEEHASILHVRLLLPLSVRRSCWSDAANRVGAASNTMAFRNCNHEVELYNNDVNTYPGPYCFEAYNMEGLRAKHKPHGKRSNAGAVYARGSRWKCAIARVCTITRATSPRHV